MNLRELWFLFTESFRDKSLDFSTQIEHNLKKYLSGLSLFIICLPLSYVPESLSRPRGSRHSLFVRGLFNEVFDDFGNSSCPSEWWKRRVSGGGD